MKFAKYILLIVLSIGIFWAAISIPKKSKNDISEITFVTNFERYDSFIVSLHSSLDPGCQEPVFAEINVSSSLNLELKGFDCEIDRISHSDGYMFILADGREYSDPILGEESRPIADIIEVCFSRLSGNQADCVKRAAKNAADISSIINI